MTTLDLFMTLEVENSLKRGEGTQCQRHEAQMTLYASKLLRTNSKDIEKILAKADSDICSALDRLYLVSTASKTDDVRRFVESASASLRVAQRQIRVAKGLTSN